VDKGKNFLAKVIIQWPGTKNDPKPVPPVGVHIDVLLGQGIRMTANRSLHQQASSPKLTFSEELDKENEEGKTLIFGEHYQSILLKLGNPNKEYVNDMVSHTDTLNNGHLDQLMAKQPTNNSIESKVKSLDNNASLFWLNYLELGIDIGISAQDSSLQKIILHSNQPEDINFSFYDRCWFSL